MSMNGKYLLVDKEILPECYLKVMEAKELLLSGKAKDISEASKIIGIARSTYYKYKDYDYFNINPSIEKTTISFIRTMGKLIEVVFLLKFLLTFAMSTVVD